MKKNLLLLLFCGFLLTVSAQKEQLSSPDGKLIVKIDGTSGQLQYSVFTADQPNEPFLNPSNIGLELGDGTVLGRNPKVTKTEKRTINQKVASPFYRKTEITDNYN